MKRFISCVDVITLCNRDFVFIPIKFFTKGTIVPSPWAPPDSSKAPQISEKSKLSLGFYLYRNVLFPVISLTGFGHSAVIVIFTEYVGLFSLYKWDETGNIQQMVEILVYLMCCLLPLVGSGSSVIVEEAVKISG